MQPRLRQKIDFLSCSCIQIAENWLEHNFNKYGRLKNIKKKLLLTIFGSMHTKEYTLHKYTLLLQRKKKSESEKLEDPFKLNN